MTNAHNVHSNLQNQTVCNVSPKGKGKKKQYVQGELFVLVLSF